MGFRNIEALLSWCREGIRRRVTDRILYLLGSSHFGHRESKTQKQRKSWCHRQFQVSHRRHRSSTHTRTRTSQEPSKKSLSLFETVSRFLVRGQPKARQLFMNSFFQDVLSHAPSRIQFEAQQLLESKFPTRTVLHSRSELFRHVRFAEEGQATLEVRQEYGSVVETWPNEDTSKCKSDLVHRWDLLKWNNQEFEIITLTMRDDGFTTEMNFIVADDFEGAKKLFLAVCEWCATTRGEVLVFEEGQFTRSEKLFQSIRAASFDDLIFPQAMLDALRDDVRRFVKSKDLYARYRVPWKRGVLLLGPPGNGKTHTLRAIINETNWPCIYVKSFRGKRVDTEEGISIVFDRARRAKPCVIVLEDLDCLIDDSNRSVLLNELDGFSQNQGLLVVASTNHPEKLDRSLLDRPSRFDRKFHFGLPGPHERKRFIEHWQKSVEKELSLSEQGLLSVVDGTHGFTFAYLKELTLCSMVSFMESPIEGAMDEVCLSALSALKAEMSSARKMLPPMPDAQRPISLM
jgi:hypothetical protein